MNVFHSPWIGYVKTSLDQLSFSAYWLNQNVPSPLVFRNLIKSRIKDIYNQSWNTIVYEPPKCVIECAASKTAFGSASPKSVNITEQQISALCIPG